MLPAIIQDAVSMQVLMLGYMNEEAFLKTQTEGLVTFFSRSRNSLWTKGETSGHVMRVEDMKLDCDRDCVLVKVRPAGPTCHTGAVSCFNEETARGFVYTLEDRISERVASGAESSYTFRLFEKGINKIAQKVGEEAVELIIEAKDNDDELFKNEAADLLFHLLVLLKAKNIRFSELEKVLQKRSK